MTIEFWVAYDTRTGEQVGMSAIGHNRASAHQTLKGWQDRDDRGGRPDLHDLIPFLSVRKEH